VELTRGKTVLEACKKIGVTDQTYYRGREEYGGLRTDSPRSRRATSINRHFRV